MTILRHGHKLGYLNFNIMLWRDGPFTPTLAEDSLPGELSLHPLNGIKLTGKFS